MRTEDYIIKEDISVINAMKFINENASGIAFICDEKKLKSIVTDGDIRRYIIKNGDLNKSIGDIANKNPHFVKKSEQIDAMEYMKKNSIIAVPVVNDKMEILEIKFLYKKSEKCKPELGIPVVIMAGGKGTRLHPYTNILPKPLIPIGEKTITEHIMDKFIAFGCEQFNLIVNYKKNLIKAFFTEDNNGYKVRFTDEKEYLGTGGGLNLLKGQINSTFFMTNCDIIVDEDYSKILDYHKKNQNLITIVTAVKNVTIPYGTLEISDDESVYKLIEKPTFSFLANTGFYIIEPEFLEIIPPNTFIHITDVIQQCLDLKKKVGTYPISESSWLDIGQMEELEKVKKILEENLS